uniref:Uncharacterized protein n=1 Tax=Zosterops lateralis melanops TaxID=1220523 RepID=A0A8D2PGD1_ZOSLA
MDGGGAGENDDEPVLVSLSAAPSPQSEAVANELQELTLQPELTLGLHHGRNPNLPPLSERKNGKWYSVLMSHVVCPHQVVVSPSDCSHLYIFLCHLGLHLSRVSCFLTANVRRVLSDFLEGEARL